MANITTDTFTAYYGSRNTPCTVIIAEIDDGTTWYCVEGSLMVNCTTEQVLPGVNVETISDIDCFTASAEIETEDELKMDVLEFIDEDC